MVWEFLFLTFTTKKSSFCNNDKVSKYLLKVCYKVVHACNRIITNVVI